MAIRAAKRREQRLPFLHQLRLNFDEILVIFLWLGRRLFESLLRRGHERGQWLPAKAGPFDFDFQDRFTAALEEIDGYPMRSFLQFNDPLGRLHRMNAVGFSNLLIVNVNAAAVVGMQGEGVLTRLFGLEEAFEVNGVVVAALGNLKVE